MKYSSSRVDSEVYIISGAVQVLTCVGVKTHLKDAIVWGETQHTHALRVIASPVHAIIASADFVRILFGDSQVWQSRLCPGDRCSDSGMSDTMENQLEVLQQVLLNKVIKFN